MRNQGGEFLTPEILSFILLFDEGVFLFSSEGEKSDAVLSEELFLVEVLSSAEEVGRQDLSQDKGSKKKNQTKEGLGHLLLRGFFANPQAQRCFSFYFFKREDLLKRKVSQVSDDKPRPLDAILLKRPLLFRADIGVELFWFPKSEESLLALRSFPSNRQLGL